MKNEQWTAVDKYIGETLVKADPILEEALKASVTAGLPQIHVSPAQGKMLHLLVRLLGARHILELGTLAVERLAEQLCGIGAPAEGVPVAVGA